MKYLKPYKLFESIADHLKSRGINTTKNRVIIDEETGDSYFFLYNFSGQIVGYQKYNPNYEKTSNLVNSRMVKYFTHVSEEGHGKQIAVWGLESLDIMNDEFVFITEGIFDAARIQEAGYPALAVLSNDPRASLKSWLKTLIQKKIVIYDNDKGGELLIDVGDFAYSVPTGKDANDLSIEEAKVFLQECLTKSGF